jgi:hypothetical protein
MPVYYNSQSATSDLQVEGNGLLQQLIAAIEAGDESQQLIILQDILAAFAPLATAAKQDTANASLASILAALSPLASSANQAIANTALQAIQAALANQATAAKQDIGNASLASIDAKLSASVGTITPVNRSGSSVPLLAANANRKGLILYNNSGAYAYVAFAATASETAFSVRIAPNSGYESSQTYRGPVSAVWASAGSGQMQVTELT